MEQPEIGLDHTLEFFNGKVEKVLDEHGQDFPELCGMNDSLTPFAMRLVDELDLVLNDEVVIAFMNFMDAWDSLQEVRAASAKEESK